MVLLGGLELVAAGYIVHKHSQNKKERQRLEQDAYYLERERCERQHQQQSQRRRKRSHSHSRHSAERKHSCDRKRPHHSHYDASYPPPATSGPTVQPTYPPTGWPAQWDTQPVYNPYHQSNVSLPSYGDPNNAYHFQQQQLPPSQPPPPFDASQNQSSLPEKSDAYRGRSETRRQSDGPAELSSSGPRTYNTHLSPTPHVRFVVPNNTPNNPGDRSPPPQYTE